MTIRFTKGTANAEAQIMPVNAKNQLRQSHSVNPSNAKNITDVARAVSNKIGPR